MITFRCLTQFDKNLPKLEECFCLSGRRGWRGVIGSLVQGQQEGQGTELQLHKGQAKGPMLLRALLSSSASRNRLQKIRLNVEVLFSFLSTEERGNSIFWVGLGFFSTFC